MVTAEPQGGSSSPTSAADRDPEDPAVGGSARPASAAVAVAGEDQLLGDRRARRRRRVGADRDGLGDAAGDLVAAVGGGDRDAVVVGALELALEAGLEPGALR